jgi:hypothetical protein
MIYGHFLRITSVIRAALVRKAEGARTTRRALWAWEVDAAWLSVLEAARVDHIDPALDRLLD